MYTAIICAHLGDPLTFAPGRFSWCIATITGGDNEMNFTRVSGCVPPKSPIAAWGSATCTPAETCLARSRLRAARWSPRRCSTTWLTGRDLRYDTGYGVTRTKER
jgi:hypothetical protein